jgi:hypothetical protein
MKGVCMMQDMVINTNMLPEPLSSLISTPQIRVQTLGKGVFLLPLSAGKSGVNAIQRARGMYTDGKLSVDEFLLEKRIEECEK